MSARLARLRRPLAALFAAAAAASALAALRPGPLPSIRVLAAARDLPAGTTLRPSDLRPLALPPGAVPSGALRTGATGRVLAAPVRRGEPLTDARVLGDALLRGYASGTVASPIRISDAATVRLLHPGDRIDVLSTGPSPTDARPPDDESQSRDPARVLVSGVPVVTVPPREDGNAQEGALVLVATDRPQAATLASAAGTLSLTITGG
ncbi:flagellar biosynthesis protein FlgA [Actinomadura graeca]|uniref:Flagellar biosynthesis protein FlgA n=1 Tax=Actinomadura graeca TaxID=2750812 RepID=A0ABX8QZK4_9ACTN|nr:RcpC/CpaB family pilus assembly protein [Actinomadura graeca]QXJ24241.1 flagellar biosynthesis protein FlgA [Actinomadura graeca]